MEKWQNLSFNYDKMSTFSVLLSMFIFSCSDMKHTDHEVAVSSGILLNNVTSLHFTRIERNLFSNFGGNKQLVNMPVYTFVDTNMGSNTVAILCIVFNLQIHRRLVCNYYCAN